MSRATVGRHWPITVILLAFCLLGVTYSVVNPLFEAPDEVWHYEYVRWLVEGQGLPQPDQVGEAPWHQEGSQPPLYYLFTALLTKPISTANAAEAIRENPHAAVGQPDSFGNKNVMIHGKADAFPWRGVVLAGHLVRLFSVLLGAVTVLAAYGTALAIFPRRRALAGLAAAFVAFNPQFIFLSAAINNDNLVNAACAAGVWLLIVLVGQREPALVRNGDQGASAPLPAMPFGLQKAPSSWQLLLLGLLIGTAALAKLSGLALAGLAGLALIIIAVRRRKLKDLIWWGLLVGVVTLAVAGWWYWRNWQLYGDPLGLQAMFDILPRRTAPPTVDELLARGQGVWRSAWAVFGWFNVPAAPWFYAIYTALCLAGLAGLVFVWPWRMFSRQKARKAQGPGAPTVSWFDKIVSPEERVILSQLALLAIWVLVIFLALVNWAQMRYPQGRLLFPAISAAAVLVSFGLAAWLPRRLHGPLAVVLATSLLILATLPPWLWIAPAYAAPDRLPAGAEAPHGAQADFEGLVRLAGYEIEGSEVQPGQRLYLTLYWEALAPLPDDYSVFIHLIDDNGIVQAQRDSFPGAGNAPTGDWQPGTILADRHAIDIPETAPAPQRLQVDVGLYDYATGERLLVDGADHWTLGEVFLTPRAGAGDVPNPVQINFDDQITLTGFELDRQVMHPGDTLGLTLWWEALDIPKMDYVVFAHLVLPPEATWAGSDQMPQGGAAPTSGWQPGQRVEDHHVLVLPAEAPSGTYFVEIGLYDPATFDRLQVNFSDKGIVLGQVKVEDTVTP